MVQIDVCDDESIGAAKWYLKSKGVTLYGLVNNAGVGMKTSNEADLILSTNFYGPKRVTDALAEMVAPGGRVVNVGSMVASSWLKRQDTNTKKLFSDPDLTWEVLEEAVKDNIKAQNFIMGGYALSKTAVTALTLVQVPIYFKVSIYSKYHLKTLHILETGIKLSTIESDQHLSWIYIYQYDSWVQWWEDA